MVDVNKPVTNPELVNSIHTLKEKSTPEAEREFVNLMKAAHFLSPVMMGERK